MTTLFVINGNGMPHKIHYAKPSITEREVRYVMDAAANGWAEHCFDYIEKFSKALCDYLKVPHAIPTSSCTGALHLALAALDVGPDDEVIIPDITWTATAAPVTYLGATPIFVDILPDTWCIDPSAFEKAITPKTKAVIPVHLYGNLCEMDEINAIAHKHGIAVIEDAAEALGSSYKGRNAGALGDFAAFSFHGTKTVTTGEGGALIVRSPKYYEKLLTLESHGRDRKVAKQFWCETIGYKYKMSNLEAALGVAQLERINELVTRKREIFNLYKSRLGDIEGLSFNPERANTFNSYWMTTVLFGPELDFNRPELLKQFAENNIDARVFFYPLSMMPAFKAFSAYQPVNSVSYRLFERGINLPSYHDMREDDIDRVCAVVRRHVTRVVA